MRIPPLLIAALGLSVLTACSATPDKVGGEAGPAGSPFQTVRASVAASLRPSLSPSPSASPSPSVSRRASPSASKSRAVSTIRSTDWANVTLAGVGFMELGDLKFRNGKASSGANNCTMLPGGARPAYAEYLTEEPANSPVTEDALILIECGSDGLDQALVPVQLGYDQKTRQASGFIKADIPSGPNRRMTFTSYRVEGSLIVTTVRKADGSRETRRYRSGGGGRWERV